jgi:hypothetical protein
MKPNDLSNFLASLNALGVMFSDELSKPRQRLYWEALKDVVTLEEWDYATMEAIRRETFHKVPLPGQLMTYIEEYRVSRRQHDKEREQAQRRTLEAAERLVLEADPVWQEAERRRKEDLRQMEEEAYKVLAKNLGPNWRDTDTHHQIPVRLPDEGLHYTPSDDPARLRALALEKIEQLKAQLAREHEEQNL